MSDVIVRPSGSSGKRGFVIIYTGHGKGKTTAAFGLALRMLGHGERVCIVQFIKSKKDSGEIVIAEKWPGKVEVHVTGHGFIRSKSAAEKQRKISRNAWDLALSKIASGSYALIVLDELTHLINLGIIDEHEVVEALAARPDGVNIIITGRDAPASIVDAADTVTEMKEIRHAYNIGEAARPGIEW